MKRKISFLILLFLLSTQVWAWRIEGDVLFLEKGDNIWEVTYSLTGDGKNWEKLWDCRLDTLIINPKDAYPNMKFKLDTLIFLQDSHYGTDHVIVDSSFFLEKKFDLIHSELKQIQNNTVNKTPFAKVLVYFLAAFTAIITGILSSLGFEYLKKRFNSN